MYPIFWTELAKDTYAALLQYLADVSLEAAIRLNDQIEQLEDRLSHYRYVCPQSPRLPRFRRCVVSKDTSLVYEVQGNLIIIVAVVDNRADHLYF